MFAVGARFRCRLKVGDSEGPLPARSRTLNSTRFAGPGTRRRSTRADQLAPSRFARVRPCDVQFPQSAPSGAKRNAALVALTPDLAVLAGPPSPSPISAVTFVPVRRTAGSGVKFPKGIGEKSTRTWKGPLRL